jgi:predicted signal transduction protein with EAL and GGDEF domain
VKLAIDDFGTGYSSLSYLKRFAVDYVKIDQTFIRGVGRCAEDEAITKAIIAMAHSLEFNGCGRRRGRRRATGFSQGATMRRSAGVFDQSSD